MLVQREHRAKSARHLCAVAAALVTSLVSTRAHAQAAFQAEYLADVGHTDGEIHAPGATFEWAWSIRNAGTESWDGEDVRLKPYGDQALTEVSESAAIDLEPGASQTVTVSGLVAPTEPGLYRQYWHIYRGDEDFTVNSGFWVEINVDGDGVPDADLISDVTLPSGSCVAEGQPTTKTWSVRNSGTSRWTATGTRLVHIRGPLHGADDEVPIGTDVAPGESASLSIAIVPDGSSQEASVWQLQGPGPGGDASVFGPELVIRIAVQPSCSGASSVCDPGDTQICCGGEGEQSCGDDGRWGLCSVTCSADDITDGQGQIMPAGCGCGASGSEGAAWWLLLAAWLAVRRLRQRSAAAGDHD